MNAATSVTVGGITITDNDVRDQSGSSMAVGGAGATGGNGGGGLGGGIFNPNGPPPPLGAPVLTLQGCRVEFNQAAGGSAGVGGTDGDGIGGGVFNVGTFNFDAATVIDHNHASTSNDDIFP